MKSCAKGFKRVGKKCLLKKYANDYIPPIYNFGGVHIGSGFLGVLTLIFITLKLTHVISWSWFWILSPLWIPMAVALAGFLIFLLISKVFK
ncbi:MAG: hypothetical protein PHF86_12470 [Candidatus Nanoarchaeia archaeon]|nr:hypothetical protein [Candidatus Nanoarchaeia archaeon]